MKYLFRNYCGYYKYCRKIPNTNKQFTFSLQTKDYIVSKEIVSIFLLKSESYYKYLKTLSRTKIMEIIHQIEEQLNEYKKQAIVEYSELERSRQIHFSIRNENGKYIDGSNPEPIKYWIKDLSKYMSGEKSDREVQELGKKILKRTTLELKQFFQSLSNNDEKLIFIQKLIKVEADLLKTDFIRWKENFDLDYMLEQNKSGVLQQVLENLSNGSFKATGAMNSSQSTNNPKNNNFKSKTKYEIVNEYIEEKSQLPSFKNLKDKIVQPLTILLQSSNKEYLCDYDEDDYLIAFNTLLYTPNGITQKKKIFIDDYDGNYVSLSEDFQNDDLETYHYQEITLQGAETLKEKYSNLKNFIDDCISEEKQYLTKNIFLKNTKFSIQHIDNVGIAAKKRLPFEDYEIKKMIDLMIQNQMYKTNTDYFYIILISLFSGMRVEEICKLKPDDIKEENKIHYFKITGKVKTTTSIRKVPIHKYLIEKLNFLDFVKSKEKNETLFDLKPLILDNKKKYSHYFLRDFSKLRDKFVSEERIETDLISFHSFRHTTATRLNEKGIPYLETASLLGHKIDKKLMTVGYTQPSLTKNNKNLNKMYLNDIKYDLEKLEKKFKEEF